MHSQKSLFEFWRLAAMCQFWFEITMIFCIMHLFYVHVGQLQVVSSIASGMQTKQ